MSKLNQIIAVEKSVKSKVIADIDIIDKGFQKPALFDGLVKQYRKRNENDEDVPAQKQNVQIRAHEALRVVGNRLVALFDITAQKDFANTTAKANVVVDNKTLVADAPVTYLLFLEKQLIDLGTLVGRVPTLDPSETWTFDKEAGYYKTDVTQTSRTKKVQKPLVLYPATEKHPAQTQLITEDETVGTWELTKFSGAIPDARKKELLGRIEKLSQAVKYAREEANGAQAPEKQIGQQITDWIFA